MNIKDRLLKNLITALIFAAAHNACGMSCHDLVGGPSSGETSSIGQPPTNELVVGSSILSLFPFLEKSDFSKSAHGYVDKGIDLTGGYLLTISSYWPTWAGSYPGQFALAINDKQSGYNAVYLRVDSSLTVQEAKVVGEAVHASVAFLALRNIPGMLTLSDYLNVQAPDQNALNRLSAITEEYRLSMERQESVVPLLQLDLRKIPDSDRAVTVFQGEYVILSFNPAAENYALKTFGAGPAVIITLYEPTSKVGVMMHVDALTLFEISMAHLASHFKSRGIGFGQSWQLAIVGGDYSSREKIFDIRRVLKSYNFSWIGQNILTPRVENVWLDLETGSLHTFEINPALQSYGTFSLPSIFPRLLRPGSRTE